MARDPYVVLGIKKNATYEEATKAYRKLAKQYHPDRNVGDDDAKAKYAEVDEAYHYLEAHDFAGWIKANQQIAIRIKQYNPDKPEEVEAAAADLFEQMDAMEPTPEVGPIYDADTQRVVNKVNSFISNWNGEQEHAFGDWTSTWVHTARGSNTLEKLHWDEAKQLFDRFPQSFAALKILQDMSPQFRLYDAIRNMFAPTTAIVKAGSNVAMDDTRHPGETAALRNPEASIDAAMARAAKIADHMIEAGVKKNAARLEWELHFLKDNLRTNVYPVLEKRAMPRSARTGGSGNMMRADS